MAKVRRATTAYVDKENKLIPSAQWRELRENDDYRLLSTFQNDRFKVMAEWDGSIHHAAQIPRAEWKPYALEVYIVMRQDIDGRELDEPVIKRDGLACERFKTADEAIAAAHAFLKRYANLSEEELAATEPLKDADSNAAEHIVTEEEAKTTLGCW